MKSQAINVIAAVELMDPNDKARTTDRLSRTYCAFVTRVCAEQPGRGLSRAWKGQGLEGQSGSCGSPSSVRLSD